MSNYPTEHQITTLANSSYSTEDLTGMALAWFDYSDGRTPIWQRIAGNEDDARAFYADMSSTDPDYLRELAADALTACGWTLTRINARKS